MVGRKNERIYGVVFILGITIKTPLMSQVLIRKSNGRPVMKDDGWELVEFCENLSHMEDHKQILTMLTRDSFTPEEMGFMMLEPSPFDVRPEQVEDLEYKILETMSPQFARS